VNINAVTLPVEVSFVVVLAVELGWVVEAVVWAVDEKVAI